MLECNTICKLESSMRAVFDSNTLLPVLSFYSTVFLLLGTMLLVVVATVWCVHLLQAGKREGTVSVRQNTTRPLVRLIPSALGH